MLQTVSALSKNSRLKNDDVGDRGDTLIVSWTHILLWPLMWQVLWSKTDWIKLILQLNFKKGLGKKVRESDDGVSGRDGGRKRWARRKQCSGGPRLGLKREGRGEECMGMDLGMWQQEWESERDGKQTGHIFSRNAIEERRFIVRTTIVAFPTMPLLQQAGILYRRPLWVSKWCTKSVFHVWAKAGHMQAYTHSNWVSAGHTYVATDFHHMQQFGERKEHRLIS